MSYRRPSWVEDIHLTRVARTVAGSAGHDRVAPDPWQDTVGGVRPFRGAGSSPGGDAFFVDRGGPNRKISVHMFVRLWYAFRVFECLAVDIDSLSDHQLAGHVLALEAARARLDLLEVRAAGRWDDRQLWALDGSLSGTAWLRHSTGMSSDRARKLLRVAKQLESMPATAAGFEAGTISMEHVERLCRTRTETNAEVFDRDESLLARHATEFDVDQFRKILRYWKASADAEGFGDDTEAKLAARRASVSEPFDGMVHVEVLLDPEAGRRFKAICYES